MEFLDEFESRPRFVLQSKQIQSNPSSDSYQPISFISSLHKPSLLISFSFSILTFFIAFFYFNEIEPLKSLLLWLAISLLLGPLAPSTITAGDIRVGVGPTLNPIQIQETLVVENPRKSTRKSIPQQVNQVPEPVLVSPETVLVKKPISDSKITNKSNVEEKEWSDLDEDLLRKFMAKNPVGKPGRWEAIAEGFNGKHGVDSVIQRAKEMGERRKTSDQDSYQKFLKDRKPVVDQRAVDEENGVVNQDLDDGKKDGGTGWSAAEDLALLNALKTFPKEVAMRWEKIADALPGRTKAACMKRVTHLKKDFRSSKAGQGS